DSRPARNEPDGKQHLGPWILDRHRTQQEAAQAPDGHSDVAGAISPLVHVLTAFLSDSGSSYARWLRALGVWSPASGFSRNAVSDKPAGSALLRRTRPAHGVARAHNRGGVGDHELHHAPDVDFLRRVLFVVEFPERCSAIHQVAAAHSSERCTAGQYAR